MHDDAPTEDAATQLSIAIGQRVRTERQQRHLTLDQLAAAAGVSRRMLINVEQGSANPSVATLLRISDALGIGLPALVEPPRHSEVMIARAGEGVVLWSSALGGTGSLILGSAPPNVVELWEWTLQAGDIHASEAHSAGTTEFLHIIGGALTITIAGTDHTLHAGDSLTFTAEMDHTYANSGEEPARYTMVVYQPDVDKLSHHEESYAHQQ